MASGPMKSQNVKRMSITGTPNQYGALLFSSDLNSIADRICGIVGSNASNVVINMMKSNGTNYFAVMKAYDGSAYTSELTITVAYI